MAKHIKVTGASSNPVYIPSESMMKVVADNTANTCVITYIGGGTVTGAIVLADFHTVIKDVAGNEFSNIITATTYILTFELDDMAENVVNPDISVVIEITV